MQDCPCGTEKNYAECCGRFIPQQTPATTPEELMRSRYTAYTQLNFDYLAATMKPPASEHFDDARRADAKFIKWLQLEVLNASQDGEQGRVEFKAHYIMDNRKDVLHEKSDFILEDGKWYYYSGMQPAHDHEVEKIGRNDVCPCGSGKKYKKCCA
jgi:SEC-C motif-containing protein